MPDYFTLAELRALPEMSNATRYTDARCEAAAAYVVGVIEGAVRTSFVGRSTTETVDGTGVTTLKLKSPFVLELTSVTVDGVSVDMDDLVESGGVLRYRDGSIWSTVEPRNVTVVYVAGYSEDPPADVKEAALRATRWHLIETNSNAADMPRSTAMSNDVAGSATFTTAGVTGYPPADRVISAWVDRLDNFGFA